MTNRERDMKLKDALPHDAWIDDHEFASKLMECDVVRHHSRVGEHGSRRWPGTHKNVECWWVVKRSDGVYYAVGWNENPSIGWSFPTKRLRDFKE